MSLKLPSTASYLCVLEQIPMSYIIMALETSTMLSETESSGHFS